MKNPRTTLLWFALALLMLAVAGPAWAQGGLTELGGGGEGESESGGKGDDDEEDLKVLAPHTSLSRALRNTENALEDMMDLFDNDCTSECHNSVPGPFLNSRTFDPDLVTTICQWESGGLTMVAVTHPHTTRDLYAKIRKVTDDPAGGGTIGIQLKTGSGPLGTTAFSIPTHSWWLDYHANDAIKTALQGAGYTVFDGPNYFVITGTPGDPVTKVLFQTTDTGIVESEVALEDIPDDPEGKETVCNPI